MKRLLLVLAVGLLSFQSLLAAPAYPYAVTITQPDGSTLTIQRFGDEFFNYTLSGDGYQIEQLSDGFYYYYVPESMVTRTAGARMRVSEPGSKSSAERSYASNLSRGVDPLFLEMGRAEAKYKREELSTMLSQKAATRAPYAQAEPGFGGANLAPKGIVLLVQFSDVKFQSGHTQQTFENMLNQDGYSVNGAIGSANNYFNEMSAGTYDPVFDASPIITLPNSMAYYGGNVGGNDGKPAQMVLDAAILASQAGVDFSEYDSDNDGYVDIVFVYYAGYNEAEGGPDNSVWPHAWVVSPPNNATGDNVIDGVRVFRYACTSELRGASGSTLAGIGTFCHEFCHVVGLPDFYDTDGSGSGGTFSQGLYNISIMSAGNYNSNGNIPPYLTAVERFMLGWLSFEKLDARSTTTYTNYPISSEEGMAIALAVPTDNDKEYFVLESRDATRWDAPLVGTGLLIYHYDFSDEYSNYVQIMNANQPNADPRHPRVMFIESAGAPYSAGGYPSFNYVAYPGSRDITEFVEGSYGYESWSGELPYVQLTDIQNNRGTVTLNATNIGVSPSGFEAEAFQREILVTYTTEFGDWDISVEDIEGTVVLSQNNIDTPSYLIQGLEPNTTYNITISSSSEGDLEQSVITSQVNKIIPAIANVPATIAEGTVQPLVVTNINDELTSVRWEVDGVDYANGEQVTFSRRGDIEVECIIEYADRSTEVITKITTVQ